MPSNESRETREKKFLALRFFSNTSAAVEIKGFSFKFLRSRLSLFLTLQIYISQEHEIKFFSLSSCNNFSSSERSFSGFL